MKFILILLFLLNISQNDTKEKYLLVKLNTNKAELNSKVISPGRRSKLKTEKEKKKNLFYADGQKQFYIEMKCRGSNLNFTNI
jgi:hypothetical protein